MDLNSMKSALFILVSAGILVLLYPRIHERSIFLQENFRSYDFFKRFQAFPLSESDSIGIDSVRVFLSSDTTEFQQLYSGTDYLSGFFNVLLQKGSQTRIAYYGDSSIEGDLITQTVRDGLQKEFGGSGVGFVPVATHLKGFRRSIYYHFSENWNRVIMNKPAPPGIHFGYLGTAFTCQNSSEAKPDSFFNHLVLPKDSLDTIAITEPLVLSQSVPDQSGRYMVEYTASKAFSGTRVFPSTRLFYSCPMDSSNHKGKVKITHGEHTRIKKLNKNQIVNELMISGYPSRNVVLEFDSICSQVIYGLSFESKEGVVLDNLAFRGNSGIWLTRIRSGVLQSFQQKLGIDLVVLQFGLNVLNPEMSDYSWYIEDMKRVIRHIRKGFPGVSILIVGPADKAIKVAGVMKTDPSIPLITNALRRVSEDEKTAFFSFFEAMGGDGSMVNWVNSQPRLANLDYTHFNFTGAEKAGELLLTFLMEAFDNYVTQQEATAVDF